MKSIYTYYKERLIEISGKNRSIYTRSFSKKTGYDLGRLFEKNPERGEEFIDFLFSGSRDDFTLLSPNEKTLYGVFGADEEAARLKSEADALGLRGEDRKKAELKNARLVKQFISAALEKEATAVRGLKREADDIEKETGRYELFVGYPFVYGGARDVLLKAPLLFFPVEAEIGDNTVALRLKRGESVRLNSALIFAYTQSRRIDADELVTEFDDLSANGLGSVDAVLAYLRKFGIKFQPPAHKNMYNFGRFREPSLRDTPELKRACVLARYSLASSIYNDYTELEKKHITSEAADELLSPKRAPVKRTAQDEDFYIVSDLDYAQRQVVEKVAAAGNMVIYGPPGTGKSQTIVNLISDAVCKGKKVLVVSQKKAALDVVFNRLGDLSDKAMFIVDPVKERRKFYETCLKRHTEVVNSAERDYFELFDSVSEKLNEEVAKLEKLSDTFSDKSPFGLSLIEMYYSSFIPGKKSGEYAIHRALVGNKRLLSYDHDTLKEAIDKLLEKDKPDIYYEYVESKKRNPYLRCLKEGVPIDTLSRARNKLDALTTARAAVFDGAGHPYARQITAHFEKLGDPNYEKLLIKTIAAGRHQKSYDFLRTSRYIFPLYPFAKIVMNRKEKEIAAEFVRTKAEVADFASDYEFLREVLDDDGYALAIDAVLGGDKASLGSLRAALADYVKVSDMHLSLDNFSEAELTVLKFAYSVTDTYDAYKNVLRKLMPIRIYHEVTQFEDKLKADLSMTVDFESIKARVIALIAEQKEISKNIFKQSFVPEYKKLNEKRRDCKDYLYQISKKQNFWPIRRAMEVFGDYLLTLFPCWLLSPENVSSILPLEKNLFDLVLFDEASQVFIESTIPSIIRGRNIVVAGDAKQLRPSATFLRRYMGGAEEEEDLTRQAALEVESLLDLAVARYDSANITYHYRSGSRELIDFSNRAFYENKLRISPNVTKSVRNKPIERIKVDGVWADRKNETEAKEIVSLLKKIFRTRKKRETVGVIAFGSEQQACIEDAIDRECRTDAAFRADVAKETSRKEDGQDVGLFVKNIENVQGDERDIIIFSIGYAESENGKVNARFGSLSADGGENRLNVAVTRAKKKIYVVTSIEPEELKVDATKNNGPKLFRAYLSYVRAVSGGKKQEVATILDALSPDAPPEARTLVVPVEKQIADKLTALGYAVETDVGYGKNRVSVAIYDKKSDKYVLGVQVDKMLFDTGETALERDVFGCRFLEQKGWKIMRVWSRDWWHNAADVIDNIIRNLDENYRVDAPKAKTK